jgi:hypothetical protein
MKANNDLGTKSAGTQGVGGVAEERFNMTIGI